MTASVHLGAIRLRSGENGVHELAADFVLRLGLVTLVLVVGSLEVAMRLNGVLKLLPVNVAQAKGLSPRWNIR